MGLSELSLRAGRGDVERQGREALPECRGAAMAPCGARTCATSPGPFPPPLRDDGKINEASRQHLSV